MPEINPPFCQIVRGEVGDCPVLGCDNSVLYRPPRTEVPVVNRETIICDAARRVVEEQRWDEEEF